MDGGQSLTGQGLCAADAADHVCAGVFAAVDHAERSGWLPGGVPRGGGAGAIGDAGIHAVASLSAIDRGLTTQKLYRYELYRRKLYRLKLY